ncbi:MAG: glycosyltransferase family 39 protein [candidate division WOR-3 bacterium]|nr:MAG: glycosyltransferase family 39 protein [candidate division WOR-3 bacterium]
MNINTFLSTTREKLLKNVVWIIIGIGTIMRIAQYLYNRSLTEGEAALAINIVQRSYTELFKPLDFAQAAPVGFLLLQKSLMNIMGNNELTLRLLPLVASIASLFLFLDVAKKSISGKAIPIALILFTIGDHLIYFSSEIKQYSSDVTITLLLIFLGLTLLEKNFRMNCFILFGVVGALSPWFSHPAVFTFYAVAAVLLFYLVRRRQRVRMTWLIFIGIIGTVSLSINYLVSLQTLSQHEGLLQVWSKSFMPLPPTSLADIQWFAYAFARIFKNPLGLFFYELLLAVLSFLVGIIVLYSKKRRTVYMLLLPILFALLASGFRKYPFQGRLLLFIAPLMFLLIAEGIYFIRHSTAKNSNIIGIALVVILLIHPILLAGYHLIRPRAPEELRTVIYYLREHHEEGDCIYLYYAAQNAFRYYSDKLGFAEDEYIIGVEARDNWINYYKDLEKLRGVQRVWIVFSHIATWGGVDEEKLFLSYLNILGTPLDAFRASGASAYLYNLSSNP